MNINRTQNDTGELVKVSALVNSKGHKRQIAVKREDGRLFYTGLNKYMPYNVKVGCHPAIHILAREFDDN